MNNKICLITGATSGIGKATAIELAKLGFILILAARSENKGLKLVDKLRKKYKVQAEFIKTDISSLKEVKKLSEQIKQKYDKIDVLINNAGSRFADYKKSVDGIELTFATNHLGHFYLSLLLIDLLKKSSSSRIINVASSAHSGKSIDFENIVNPKNYNKSKSYGQSKLANILFTYEMARKLSGTNVTINAMDPGGVATNLGRNNGIVAWAKHYIYYLIKLELISPKKAAETIIWMATSKELSKESGKYYFDKKEKRSSKESYNEESAKKLWNLSLELCGIETEK